MTLLLLGEGCPFVPLQYYWNQFGIMDEEEEEILLAYMLMRANEPTR